MIGKAQKDVQTNGLKLGIDDRGKITSFYGDKEYLPAGTESYLIRANIAGEDYTPTSVEMEGKYSNCHLSRMALRFW